MKKMYKKSSAKKGQHPGFLSYTGERKTGDIEITLIDYDEQNHETKTIKKIDDIMPFKDKKSTTWININYLYDEELIGKVGKYFNIHPLVLEDILNIDQRPKIEEFDEYIFIVIKMLTYNKLNHEISSEQISFIVGNNFVLSFQEHPGDVFELIRERIKNDKGRIRKMGADYLAYSLIDAIVDNYFIILENISDRSEMIEEEVIENPSPATAKTIHHLKRELIFLRRAVWPLREVIAFIERTENSIINNKTVIYFRDVYDHTIQVIDNIETFKDITTGILDIYLSSISNKMNEIMKVLTIIATIFIPLTFIAGIYGMNFPNIPEFGFKYSYPILLLIMLIIAKLMYNYFKRKNWL